jgi:phosphoribosylamine---glycine ligase
VAPIRFLLIDPFGDALDVALRAQAHNHEVRHFIRDTPKTKHIGAGMVNVIRDFTSSLSWADLTFLADNTLYLRQIDSFRAFKPRALIVGPTQELAQWELDRRVGFKILEDQGIEVPPYHEFSDYDSAISYVKKEDRRFVSKPFGDGDKAMTYAASGPEPVEDMLFMLNKWKKKFGRPKSHFILQEFVPGIEMAVGMWVGPGGPDLGWNENWEFKKLLSSNYGPNTGELGTVLRFTKRSKLARRVLEPLVETLGRMGYVGYIDVNCIVSGDTAYPLEFTIRPGYPTINIEAEVHSCDDPCDRLYALAKGEDCRSVMLDQVAVGVVVALPSFPHSHALAKEIDGIPIHGVSSRIWPHFHCCQVRMENDELQTAGDYVAVLTASGDTVSGARAAAYNRVKKVHIPGGVAVRDDIAERLAKQLPVLQEHSYATGLGYSASLS